jgi:hypothetical protein
VVRVGRGLRARAGRTRLRIHDHAPAEQPARDERRKAEQRRRRKATGIADEPRAFDALSVRLRQAIDKLALQLRRGVLAPVVLQKFARVAQTKIARQVNHTHMRGQARRDLQSLPVRQREEHAIHLRQTFKLFRRGDETQLRQPVKIAMHLAHRLARLLVRRHERDLHVRAPEQDAQQLRPAVTRTAKDADFKFHVSSFSSER